MKIFESFIKYFSKAEWLLWLSSIIMIVIFYIIFDRANFLTLSASLIGVTSLIFNAKGNPIGQFLMVIFSLVYGIISFQFAYYGEMITYLGMTMPMAIFSFFSWVKNPYNEGKSEVKINRLSKNELVMMWILAFITTFVFYFILKYFNTANLFFSTISVTTSFISVYLTFKRSPFLHLGMLLTILF